MSDDGQWERPIGLTKEYAICVDSDDSDDDVESPGGDKHTIRLDSDDSDDDGKKSPSVGVATKCASSRGDEAMSSKTKSSYFHSGGNSIASKSDSKGDANAGIGFVRRTSDGIYPEPETENIANPTMKKRDGNRNSDESSIISPSEKENVATKNDNPFASFSFVAGEAAVKSQSWRPNKRPRENPKSSSHPHLAKNKKQVKSSTEKKETREELISKWHSFADSNAPIEQQRFQVLVAARLHARCQEQVVTKAMVRLRKYFNEKEGLDGGCCNAQKKELTPLPTEQGVAASLHQPHSDQESPVEQGLTVNSLAKCTPEMEIAPLLSSVLFGNTKANHIVQAAIDIRTKFRGRVPESIHSLKEITGIGPKLAEILSIVNRRQTYKET